MRTRILGLMTCFNRKEKTIVSINNLISKNPNIEFGFVVVDDNSTDGTKAALEKIRGVVVLNGTGQLFYSGGMRMAMQYALDTTEVYDYCLLFNDDVKFYSQTIEKMLSVKNTGREILVGPTCDTEGKLSYGGVIKKSRFRPKFDIIDGTSQRAKSCDTFNANCVLIPWKMFKELGNMDSIYSHSLGDFDYGFKASRRGIPIWVCDFFVGQCSDNPVSGSWRDTDLSRRERLKKKESPKGLPRKEWWHYLKTNYSIGTAIVYSITPYLRILIRR